MEENSNERKFYSRKEVFATEEKDLAWIIHQHGIVQFFDTEFYAFDKEGNFTAVVDRNSLEILISNRLLI